MLSVAHLLKLLGVNKETLRRWEKKGILFPAVYRNERGDRYYTYAQVEAIVNAYRRSRHLKFPQDRMIRFIKLLKQYFKDINYLGLYKDDVEINTGGKYGREEDS